MPIEALNDTDLLAFHQEILGKARLARASGDLDTAQRYLRVLSPMNAEMSRRMAARRMEA